MEMPDDYAFGVFESINMAIFMSPVSLSLVYYLTCPLFVSRFATGRISRKIDLRQIFALRRDDVTEKPLTESVSYRTISDEFSRIREPLIKSGKNQADADREVGGRATHGAVAEIKVFRVVAK